MILYKSTLEALKSNFRRLFDFLFNTTEEINVTTGLFDKSKSRLKKDKGTEATAEQIGQSIVYMAFNYLKNLNEVKEKYDSIEFKLDRSKELLIFKELFIFYFSFISIAPFFKEMNSAEANTLGKNILDEAFKSLSEAQRSEGELILNDSFMEKFDEGFQFYYHDQMTKYERINLQKEIKFLKKEATNYKDNPLRLSDLFKQESR